MEPPTQPPLNLYTAVVKCHLCLKTLVTLQHIEQRTRLPHIDCPEHPKALTIVEWERE